MRRVTLVALMLVGLVLPARVNAETFTVATFADPTLSAATPLFTYTQPGADPSTTATIAGGWDATLMTPELDLIFTYLGTTYGDVSFTFSTLTATGGGTIADGYEFDGNGSSATAITSTLTFYNALGSLLIIEFERAFMNTSALGNQQEVSIVAEIVDIYCGTVTACGDPFSIPETFAFSFTNSAGAGLFNTGTTNLTASFTSSATYIPLDQPVPEPGSMLLLGTGLLGLATSARRQLRRRDH